MVSQEFIRNNLYHRSILSYLLYPFSLIFSLIQVIRRAIYHNFTGLSYTSSCPVISIGNIVSGGSGKTPLTIFLAEYLTRKGKKIAVSHRGYKGDFEKNNKLISDQKGVFSIAKHSGDEAFLLADKLLGIPVITGKNRKRSIQILNNIFPDLDYIILDDSFQHLKVKHNLDLITISAQGGLGNGFVLPAGILREPLKVLKKADFIVLNGGIEIPAYLNGYEDKVILGEYRIKGLFDLNKREIERKSLASKKIVLLSGIGNPLSFENTIREAGFLFEEHICYPDHHDYVGSDLLKLKKIVSDNKIDLIITTEKDYVKLKKLNTDDLNFAVLKIEFYSNDLKDLENL